MKEVRVKLLGPLAKVPTRGTPESAGLDIYACIPEPVIIQPGETHMISSGIAMELEPGYAGFLYARSGLGVKHGIVPANCVGVLDSDYRGEILVGLKNTSQKPYIVQCGDRIAQLVISQCMLPQLIVCDTLSETIRGEGGFGSSGNN